MSIPQKPLTIFCLSGTFITSTFLAFLTHDSHPVGPQSMSFTIEIAAGVKPNDRSELSSGLHFSRHPKSVYRPTDVVSEQLPSLSQLPDVPALSTEDVDVGDTTRSEEVEKGERDKPYAEQTLERTARASTLTPLLGKSGEAYGDIAPKKNIITITGYLHDGHLWDFWSAEHPQLGSIVLKVIFTPCHPCRDPDLDDYVPYEEILQEALKEERCYTDPLKQLQGTVVPKYYGLYTSGKKDRYLAIILEHAGQSLGSRYLIIPEEWQLKIYEAYKRIHLQGVLHHNLDGRHILNQDERVRLVSFSRSHIQDVKDPAHVKRLLKQASNVRGGFGFRSGEELNLNKASPDYWAALPDPAAFKNTLDRAAQR
ncbi:hypothetical protein I204_03876 [Kwoniella mangroviensis CBS 8886]|nr:hypothetical protein I204_03876 [Kwoniella mangroviensis CBS 8886]